MNLKKTIQYLFSVGLALALLFWVLKDIDFNTLLENFKNANYTWVLLAGLASLLAHWSRGYRWKIMLQPLGYNPSAYHTTLAVLIAYLINLILPRAGELARSASLLKSEGVPFEKSFGAVIAERVVDVLVLLLIMIVTLALEFNRISELFFEIMGDKIKNPKVLIIAAGVCILGLVLLILIYKKFKSQILKNKFILKIQNVLVGLWGGFSSITKLKNPLGFIFHTCLIWFLYYFMTYALCMSLTQTSELSPIAALTILVMGSIGMAAPTLGGIGSYHFLVGKIVTLYGLSSQDGITLATFLHSMMGLAFVILFGLIAFLLSMFIKAKSPEPEAK
jgi:glycosyltransferase 2 family protein